MYIRRHHGITLFIRNIFHFDRTERMTENKNEIYVKIMQSMIKLGNNSSMKSATGKIWII